MDKIFFSRGTRRGNIIIVSLHGFAIRVIIDTKVITSVYRCRFARSMIWLSSSRLQCIDEVRSVHMSVIVTGVRYG